MNRPEDIRDRLANVHQIGGIISALRAIAASRQAEARAHVQAIRAQEATVAEALRMALALGAPPPAPPEGPGITIVIGAAQGFSGSYGDRMAEAARAACARGDRLMVIGSRTIGALTDSGHAPDWSAELSARAADIGALAIRVADALYARLAELPEAPVRILHADPEALAEGARMRSLFPFDTARFGAQPRPMPVLTLPPARLLAALIAEYVFTEICEVLMLGHAAENAARAEAMSRAQSAVKRMAGALQKEFQRARQDQMTTEIVELATAAEVVAGQA